MKYHNLKNYVRSLERTKINFTEKSTSSQKQILCATNGHT